MHLYVLKATSILQQTRQTNSFKRVFVFLNTEKVIIRNGKKIRAF